MPEARGKKFSIGQVFFIQVAVSFVVIGILIGLGGLLVFKVMGTEYTRFTAMGFIASVYLSFIAFQPAGTLFAARKEIIEGKVILPEDARAGGPVVNPWKKTLPVSIPTALACTAAVPGIIFAGGYVPAPGATVFLALLFVIPYYFITKKFLEPDLISLALNGPGSGALVPKGSYFWGTFILPNIIFQSIINIPLGIRGFSREAAKLAQTMPDLKGFVPMQAVAGDLTVTFMVVCTFTFLAAVTYTQSGIYQGTVTFEGLGKGRGIHGFLFFLIMLVLGVVVALLYGALPGAAGTQAIPFEGAIFSKIGVVVLAVYLGSRMALGWTAKKMRTHIEAGAGA